jgi:hypothetical protein
MATIDPEKLKQFFVDNPELKEEMDAEEAERLKRLTAINNHAKELAVRSKELREDIAFMTDEKHADLFAGSQQLQDALMAYTQIIGERNAISQETLELINPPMQPQGDTIQFPDPDNPNGVKEFTFAPGRINDIIRTPETLAQEVMKLQESDAEGAQDALNALTHVLGQEMIDNAMVESGQGSDIEAFGPTRERLTIEGSDVQITPAQTAQQRQTFRRGIEERARQFGSIGPSRGIVPDPRQVPAEMRATESIRRINAKARKRQAEQGF